MMNSQKKTRIRSYSVDTTANPAPSLAVGDLVEHIRYPAYRGIISQILKTRGNSSLAKPRVVEVRWFPPLAGQKDPVMQLSYQRNMSALTGITECSVLHLTRISPASKP